MSRRLLKLLFLGASLALPEAARAQLTGTVSAILTGGTIATGETYSGSGTSSLTSSNGETVVATAATFGTWNSSSNTTTTYNTTILFTNANSKGAVAEIKFGGSFELKLALTGPVTQTVSLGVWNWVFDNGTFGTSPTVTAGKDQIDYQLVGQNNTSYAAVYSGTSYTWKDNKTGGSFAVSTQSGNTLTTSTYSFTVYSGYVTGTGATIAVGSLVDNTELKEGKSVTVNAGFQITSVSTSVTTVPEPSTYALGATSLLLGAMGLRSVRRRRAAAAKSPLVR